MRLKALKNTLIYVVLRLVLAVLRRLPVRTTCALGDALGRLAWVLAGRERRRALANLAHARPQWSAERRVETAREMLRRLGRGAGECAVLERLLARPGAVRFEEGSVDALRSAVARGRGVVFVTAHLGNWELMGAAVARLAPVSVLYKPSYDPRLTRLMKHHRTRVGVAGIDVSRPSHLREALGALAEGRVLGLLVDQPVNGAAELPFLGQPAPTSTLAARLVQRTGASVVVGFIRRVGPCQHAIRIRLLDLPAASDTPSELTRHYLQEVEEAIGEEPSSWVWSMDRWRLDMERSIC